MNRRAILSVYDKSGLVELGWGLVELGWQLIASGGTAAILRQAGLTVTEVSEITGAPEMLGGRVKTLHPAVHAGILARDTDADQADLAAQNMGLIDLVVCNLYPFTQTVTQPDVTLADAVEQIDVGGVTLLRAAGKNFARVTVVCDPADYAAVLAELQANGTVGDGNRQQLAVKVFTHTRDYDAAVAAYLQHLDRESPALPSRLSLNLVQAQLLRYGENPHQAAALYAADASTGPLGGRLLQGKPLSYNNLLDLDAAWRAAEAFAEPAVVVVKHLSPCGIATANTVAGAFPVALASDPISAFGGVVAANRPLSMDFVQVIADTSLFVEAVVAPGFNDKVQAWFAQHKKNCRLVEITNGHSTQLEIRTVRGGILVQEADRGDPAGVAWRVASQRQPSDVERAAMRLGWTAVQHVKSNGIVLATPEATVGIGSGLPSRVDAVRVAVMKAGERARGAVMASDAFFPFPDGIEVAAEAGITAIIQPGGSIRDEAVIATADRLNLALVFTGVRHFRH